MICVMYLYVLRSIALFNDPVEIICQRVDGDLPWGVEFMPGQSGNPAGSTADGN
jgi:hypothetical protein